MSWSLIKRKDVVCRKIFVCCDCEIEHPPGTQSTDFIFTKDGKFSTKKVCEDCEKYYKRKDFKMEG